MSHDWETEKEGRKYGGWEVGMATDLKAVL
jgi:hypothetical protein